ncbi:hypothetical protein MA3A0930R_0015 [Mycobacteroides abscessus 3A-0930-R]|nr:hypothetical protein MA3A0930R_0015 [Mycobacteroides abscessus 3A-0930-R]
MDAAGRGGAVMPGSSRVPRHRGHQYRRCSRTFHWVPQREHTWIIRPA